MTDAADDRIVTAETRPPVGDDRPLVLFDGACPICRREIAHYRRLGKADRIVWIDISNTVSLQAHYGIDPADAMAQFHVRDGAGRWHLGAAGFVELWSQLPGYRRLAALVRFLRLVGPMDRAYRRFAAWRLRRRCRDDCGDLAHTTVGSGQRSTHTPQSNHDTKPH